MFSLFAWLWAMSMIWHYLRPDHGYHVTWADLLVVLAAILVLLRPHNYFFLLATALANVAAFLLALPTASNHWTLQFFVNVTLVASFILAARDQQSLVFDSAAWLRIFRPVVCLLIIFLYLFASLHKFNAGYFSDHSFALRFYRDIVFGEHMVAYAHFFPTQDSFLAILPHLSLLTELVIPILLFIRRTRLAAILVGILFHTLLSLKEYPPGTDFPTLLGAAYVLFLPLSSFDYFNGTILRRMRCSSYFPLFKRLIAPTVLLALIFVPPLYSLPRITTVDWFTFANLKSVHWALYATTYFVLILFLIYKIGPDDFDHSLLIIRSVRFPLIIIVVAIVIVGMSPYLGLRSAGAFAMFSNLETEGNYTNHFFMPSDMQIFPYQKQVCVIDTTAEDIPKTALTGRLLTYYNFRQLTRRYPEAAIKYTFEGERFELERITDKPDLVAEPDLLERYYLIFQRTDWDKKTTYCDWRW